MATTDKTKKNKAVASLLKHVPELASEHAPKLTAATVAAVRTYEGVDAARLELLSKSEEATEGADLPVFSLGSITSSFRKLNSRSKVLWELQYQIARFLSWRQPAFTLSILCCYTFVCLKPYLAVALPLVGVILGIMVPGFDQRHPRTVHLLSETSQQEAEVDEMGDYTPKLKSKDELTEQDKDFIMILRQLQLSLGNAVQGLEKIDHFVYGLGAFVDERHSSALFIILTLSLPLVVLAASFVPLQGFLVALGWALVILCHPHMNKKAKEFSEAYLKSEPDYLGMALEHIRTKEIIMDSQPEERIVEIFELQRQGPTPRIWDPWVYTPLLYTIKSPYRLSGSRPPGERFIEDILPPSGWRFEVDKDWQVDENTKGWVRDRAITGVEVDIDHHWAYDYKDGLRGEWRRRRWTRKVYRDAAEPLKKAGS